VEWRVRMHGGCGPHACAKQGWVGGGWGSHWAARHAAQLQPPSANRPTAQPPVLTPPQNTLDNSNRAFWPIQGVNRWLSVRLELMGETTACLFSPVEWNN
jgi:hypothetical protein